MPDEAEMQNQMNELEPTAVEEEGKAQTETAAPSQEELLTLFFGPNAEPYLRAAGYGPQTKKGWKLNWAVFVFAYPWFFYRKLYLVGLLLLLVPPIVAVVVPGSSFIKFGGFGVFLAATANVLYVWHAQKKIAKLKKLGLPPEELKQKVVKTGGTSTAGAIFGSLIFLALFSLPFLEQNAKTTLPGCYNTNIQETTKEMLRDNLKEHGLNPEKLKVSDFKAVPEKTTDVMNVCSFTIEIDSEKKILYLSINLNRDTSQINLKTSTSIDEVVKLPPQ